MGTIKDNSEIDFIVARRVIYLLLLDSGGFPGGSDGKESACNVGDLDSILGQEDPLEKRMATLFSILAWKSP